MNSAGRCLLDFLRGHWSLLDSSCLCRYFTFIHFNFSTFFFFSFLSHCPRIFLHLAHPHKVPFLPQTYSTLPCIVHLLGHFFSLSRYLTLCLCFFFFSSSLLFLSGKTGRPCMNGSFNQTTITPSTLLLFSFSGCCLQENLKCSESKSIRRSKTCVAKETSSPVHSSGLNGTHTLTYTHTMLEDGKMFRWHCAAAAAATFCACVCTSFHC